MNRWLLRMGYRLAYRVARGWWRVHHPKAYGALVALWQDGELLVVQTSYRPGLQLPGGFIRPGEPAVLAAIRELREEVGVHVPAWDLHLVGEEVSRFEHREDHVIVFEHELPACPDLRIDGVEVVWAGFVPPSELRARRVVPHLRRYIDGLSARRSPLG